MGSLFDSGTKEVKQQATQTALSPGEVSRLASVTGQQQKVNARKRQQPPRTVLGVPVQSVGDSSPNSYGGSFGAING